MRLGEVNCRAIATLILALALPATVLPAGPAAAQSCFSLQAELMHLLSRGVGGSGDRSRYERAYREQSRVLARTEQRARDAGCFGGGFFLFRRQDRSCDVLIPSLREMQDNLAQLDQLRRQGGSGNSWRVRELQEMMGQRGCDLPGGAFAAPQESFQEDPFQRGPVPSSGTYRTLCVRSCDGYYFPISFATSQDQFGADQQTCASMCPAGDARLYYYDNPGGAPESMMSIDGQAYTSLPTAFRYRTSYDPACTCRAGGALEAALGTPPADAGPISLPPDPTAPKPQRRPGAGEDPETLANRAGGLSIPMTSGAALAAAAPTTTADGRAIRVIGPPLGSAQQDELVISPVPN